MNFINLSKQTTYKLKNLMKIDKILLCVVLLDCNFVFMYCKMDLMVQIIAIIRDPNAKEPK